MPGIVEVFSTLEELSHRAAALIADAITDALHRRPVARIALSGGSTPRRTYELLADNETIADRGLEIFFADERCVPPTDHASNYRLVAAALGPRDNIMRIRGEIPPEEAAGEYEAILHERSPEGLPAFDLVVLGIGTDGHTASLFPGEPELDERTRWVVATKRPHAWVRRVTLTLPVLNAARHAVILASGAEKAKAVADVIAGGSSPAARVLGARLLLDEAAAGFGAPRPRRRARPPTDELLDLSRESDGE